jgi:DNA-binding NtrC family response regulator
MREDATNGASVLIVEDQTENLRLLAGILAGRGYHVRPATDGELALQFARTTPPDLILLDIRMHGLDGYAVCERLKADERTRDIPVLFISALDEPGDKVQAFASGAVDYIVKPFQSEEVLARVETHLALSRLRAHLEELVQQRTAELEREIAVRREVESDLRKALTEIERLKEQLQADYTYLRDEVKLEHNFEDIVGRSEALSLVLNKIEQVAPVDTTVLIQGETGTGKELVARAIHGASGRKDRPLVKVNCAALPPTLIESELFGHEKGAFTGALGRRAGRFEMADGATVFLDEVGELPLELQPKLLRVLHDGEFERLGSDHTLRTDTRVLAATNRDLKKEIQEGRFREDLYYRLSAFPIEVPPLRDRREDIPLLVQWFVERFNKKLGRTITSVPQRVMTALEEFSWPGNVRELANVIERAMVTSRGSSLRLADPLAHSQPPAKDAGRKTLAEVEREHFIRVLESCRWRIEGAGGAAEVLGLNPSTVRFRMKKLRVARMDA